MKVHQTNYMKVICIKTFTYENSTFIKNLKYYLMQYEGQNIFYVGVIPDEKGPIAAYTLSKKYRCNFISLTELRKLKLEKLYESR